MGIFTEFKFSSLLSCLIINEMVNIIDEMKKKNIAYEKKGTIYAKISSIKNYPNAITMHPS